MKNIVVFASGSGSNFQSIIDAVQNGSLHAHIAGLISNKSGIKALERAEKHGIPTLVISETEFHEYEVYERQLLLQLENWNTDLIALAGYLRKIPASIIKAFENRILNIHPSLLPKYGGKGFYGINVHKAVLEAKETMSGCSIHVVSEEYDKGPILEQATVDVLASDTPEELAARVLQQEHLIYPKVIETYLNTLNEN
ncbi:MAG: phosphoribosylglycinamide formyltransferase [Balneolaceae bacterium]